MSGEKLIINGMPVYISDATCVTSKSVQFRFPRSKKKRIVKKWAKNKANFMEVTTKNAIVADGRFILVSTEMFHELKKQYDSAPVRETVGGMYSSLGGPTPFFGFGEFSTYRRFGGESFLNCFTPEVESCGVME